MSKEAAESSACEGLFVFVGAGVSCSAPTSLPSFNAIRDAVLCGLELNRYVAGEPGARPELIEIAQGLFPERFLLALSAAGFALESWLGEVLGRVRPNAAHRVLAQLAVRGAKVWTVNYDHNIEQASHPPLDVLAWPAEPGPAAVVKPHGSLGGHLVATAEQVVRGLDPAWLGQLRRDLAGRKTVIFLGYSGRDLDFHPYWDELLAGAERVLWFDFSSAAQDFKRTLLHETARRGALIFPEPATPPPGVPSDKENPSWDFIAWCRAEGLADIPDDQAAVLFAEASPVPQAPLQGDSSSARAALLGLLGAYREQRRGYLELLSKPRMFRVAAPALAMHEVNHGGRTVAYLLWLGRLLPPIGRRLTSWREFAERKRLTVLSRVGDHAQIIRATNQLPSGSVSTYKILRAESLRLVGSLTEAVAVADEAYQQALTERHNVRIAHAAYQKVQALVWADRTEEAKQALDDELDPHAALAASRWVAWASFLRAAILVRDGDIERSAEQVRLAVQRFRGEALTDGVVSAELIRLTIARRAVDGFDQALAEIRQLMGAGEKDGVYYTRGHPFTDEAITLEEAEFARMHTRDLDRAGRLYGQLAESNYPLHQAFGSLGLALLADGNADGHLQRARVIAERLGQRLVLRRCQLLAERRPDAAEEMFFC